MSGSTGDSTAHPFSRALQVWGEIDLPQLQQQLDQQGSEIKQAQKTALVLRKELAARTKAFKRMEDADKLVEMKGLLKLYQQEIDLLTTKNKQLDSYFFDVYRQVSEAPDPKPLLEALLDAVLEALEAQELRREVLQLRDKLTRYADYEQLQKKLLTVEQQLAETIAARVKAKEQEMGALMAEKELNWAQQQEMLLKQAADAKKTIEELKTLGEVDALKQGTAGPASSLVLVAELAMMTRQYELATARVLELEKRNEKLLLEASKAASSVSAEATAAHQLRDNKINELELENATLVARLEHQRFAQELLNQQHQQKTDLLVRDTARLTQEIGHLKERLASTKDYDSIKNELQILKTILFGDDEDLAGEVPAGVLQVDAILVARNKKLSNEATEYRAQHALLVERIAALEAELEQLKQTEAQLQLQAFQLERDLNDVGGPGPAGSKWDALSVISSVSRVPGMGGHNPRVPAGAEDSALPMLPIITKQRDRFRQRNAELEAELKQQFRQINELKHDVAKLKADNEQLYERTRYMASFSSGHPAANAADPYKDGYEERLNPIEQFRAAERERVQLRLLTVERVFILFARAILASKSSRMLFFGYCVGLHCLVMVMTVYVTGLYQGHTPDVAAVAGGVAGGTAAGTIDKVQLEHPIG